MFLHRPFLYGDLTFDYLKQPYFYSLILMKQTIIAFIDLFYPPFKKLMPIQTFRYAACGGFNMVFGFVTFTLLYRFVFGQNFVNIGGQVFEPYSVALFLSSAMVFIIGFAMNKYLVFTASNLRGRIQLFRYFLSFVSNLAINYVLLKFFVKYLDIYPVFAQVLVTFLVVIISYFTQQNFTFKTKKED